MVNSKSEVAVKCSIFIVASCDESFRFQMH